jgi:hypothetical protein
MFSLQGHMLWGIQASIVALMRLLPGGKDVSGEAFTSSASTNQHRLRMQVISRSGDPYSAVADSQNLNWMAIVSKFRDGMSCSFQGSSVDVDVEMICCQRE